MTPIRCVSDFARHQHRVITLEQLQALGLDREQVRHMVRTARLWRVFLGVYALEGPLEPIGRAQAAVLRMGDRSVLHAFSAAVLADLWRTWPYKPQVVVANGTGSRGPKGIKVTHTSTLLRTDVTSIHGIRTTTPRRTILDCAPALRTDPLKRMLRAAEFHHRLDLTTLDVPRAPRVLQELLKIYVRGSGVTGNELEALFLELCAAHGIPMPEVQRHSDRFRVDFVWRDLGLIVETDGRNAHDRSIAFTEDRRRDRAHTLKGLRTLRFTWSEIVYDAQTVAADLLTVISGR
ncbi:MAG: hypothetical protein QOF76_5474 [Solirubrobacteraceae bacterium]|jgi:hypothetical protein|nr:hypothetical protein [Solirubrobacteraceae bacterium]